MSVGEKQRYPFIIGSTRQGEPPRSVVGTDLPSGVRKYTSLGVSYARSHDGTPRGHYRQGESSNYASSRYDPHRYDLSLQETSGICKRDPSRWSDGSPSERSTPCSVPSTNCDASTPTSSHLVTLAIRDRLSTHPWLDARDIGVLVSECGTVYLTGVVSSREALRRAEDAVRGVPGVQSIRNEIRIRRMLSEFPTTHRNQKANVADEVSS